MDCKQARELLSAQLDAEIGVSESTAVETHLQSCLECQAEFAEQSTVRGRLKGQATYFSAPAYLQSRIKAALPRLIAPERASTRWTWNWLQLAPSLAGVLALAWGLNVTLNQPSKDDVVAQDVIASHVRSLMSNRVTDVASSDQHTVKPWFSGKLDYAPAVRDLSAQDFPLIGGRLDYVGGRPVAALLYRHRQHFIAVYQWPAHEKQKIEPKALSRQGYHVVTWSDGAMARWAVSDLDPQELMALVEMLRAP